MPCKNRHEKNVPKHKKCSGTFSFIVREILIYLAPSQRLVIEAAEDMGIRTVAEGVETEEQLAVLRKLGCPRAQGYLLSRPLPVEQFAALLS